MKRAEKDYDQPEIPKCVKTLGFPGRGWIWVVEAVLEKFTVRWHYKSPLVTPDFW